MRGIITAIAFTAISWPAAALAQPVLTWPVACKLNESCWFMNYADMQAEAGRVRDPSCKTRTYDGHNGTDIAITDIESFTKGIDVLAAASGTVFRLRDGEEDALKKTSDIAAITESKRECGNGIILDHGDGWLTQYCHLKNGSLKVKQGDKVKAGQPIAQIGLSGITQHPHLHLSVLKDQAPVDPFTGQALAGRCGIDVYAKTNMWQDKQISYQAFSLIDGGFTSAKPDFERLSHTGEKPAPATASSKSLIFWMTGFGAEAGDEYQIVIKGPDGKTLLDKRLKQEARKARQYWYAGVQTPNGLAAGTYTATVTQRREDRSGGTVRTTLTRQLIIS